MPPQQKKRYVVLDALRGFAILGIILANFPEFSLWTFSDPSTWTRTDTVTRAVQTFFVDGKFYTLFSLLFGVGFSIQIANAGGKLRTFYRRMAVLLCIGLIHLFFLWSGDILALYAVCGMILPLFRKLPTRKLLTIAGCLFFVPVVLDAIFGTRLADPLEQEQWRICGLYGITEANFGTWLSEDKIKPLMKRILAWGLTLGIPFGILYTWSSMQGSPWGKVAHDLLYLLSVYPMGFAYAAGFGLLFSKSEKAPGWMLLAYPGKMACTNYLSQSVIGILLFYGIGLGLGNRVGLLGTELIALGVYAFQILVSTLWMRSFTYGPVEWVWRMLSYGKRLPLRRS